MWKQSPPAGHRIGPLVARHQRRPARRRCLATKCSISWSSNLRCGMPRCRRRGCCELRRQHVPRPHPGRTEEARGRSDGNESIFQFENTDQDTWNAAIAPRHSGTMNVLAYDGHVAKYVPGEINPYDPTKGETIKNELWKPIRGCSQYSAISHRLRRRRFDCRVSRRHHGTSRARRPWCGSTAMLIAVRRSGWK